MDHVGRRTLIAAGLPLIGAAAGDASVRSQLGEISLARSTPVVDQVVVADPGSFAGIDPSGSSNSQAGLQKAFDATPAHGSLVIPEGTYRVEGLLSNRGRPIHISAYGATLVKARDANTLSLYRSWDATLAVRSVAPDSIPSGGTSIPTIKITLATAAAWAPGDIVKVFADDPIPGARPGTDGTASRSGQYFVVQAQAGTEATLIGTLVDSLSTNVRVARMATGNITLRGATFRTVAEGLTAQWKTGLCVFNGVAGALVEDVTVTSSPTAAINMKSCFGYHIRNVSIRYARDVPEQGTFGYGIIDTSGAFGTISQLSASFVRHAYSDDSARISSNSTDVSAYGRSYGHQIIDSECSGATAAAFDTHHAAEGIVFQNCRAFDSAAGFSLRGRKHRVNDSSARGCPYGIHVFTEAGGESWGHLVNNFQAIGASASTLRVHLNQTGHPQAGQLERRPIDVVGLNSTDAGPDFIYAVNATLRITNASMRIRDALPDGSRLIHQNNGAVSIENMAIDLTQNFSGTTLDIWTIVGGAYTSARANNVALSLAGQSARVRYLTVRSGSTPIHFRNVTFSEPLSSIFNQLSSGSFVNWATDDRKYSASALTANQWDVEQSHTAQGIAGCSERNMTLTSDPGAVPRTLTTLLPASFHGQNLTVINSGSANTIRIRHGAEFGVQLASKADKVLQPRISLRLIALPDGLWHEVA